MGKKMWVKKEREGGRGKKTEGNKSRKRG